MLIRSKYSLSIRDSILCFIINISGEKIFICDIICETSSLWSNVFLDFINQETKKKALKKNTQELIDRGGFGSPTYFFEGSMFFGNDRIPLLEEQLKVNWVADMQPLHGCVQVSPIIVYLTQFSWTNNVTRASQ